MSGWERVPAALHLDTSIPPAARALYPVLLYLAWNTGQDIDNLRLTGREIADAFGASMPTTRDCLHHLERAGWVSRERPSRREAQLFRIHAEPVPVPSEQDSLPRVSKDLVHTPLSPDLADNPSGSAAEILGANDLVAGYVDAVRAQGVVAPRRVVGMVAKGVGELISEGVDPAVVERALALLIERRLHPSTLPTLVLEAAAGPRQAPSRYGRGLTTRQILDMTKGR